MIAHREPANLVRLGVGLSQLYERSNSSDHLDEAASLLREARQSSVNVSDVEGFDELLISLGRAYLHQYRQTRERLALDNAIDLANEALELPPGDNPERAAPISLLHLALAEKGKQVEPRSDIASLDDKIRLAQEALGLFSEEHPQYIQVLIDLDWLLYERYKLSGDAAYLKNSVRHSQKALQLCPKNHPKYVTLLLSSANSSIEHFIETDDIVALEEVLLEADEALEHLPYDHPDRPEMLSTISSLYNNRFRHKGNLDDLEDSIRVAEEALGLCPKEHPNRATALESLIPVLYNRYRQTGDNGALEEATRFARESLELYPKGHLSRAGSVANLAICMTEVYQLGGNLSVLQDAIGFASEWLELIPPGLPGRFAALSNLAVLLVESHRKTEDLATIENAIRLFREAVNLCPKQHVDSAIISGNLAGALEDHFDITGDSESLREVLPLRQLILRLSAPGDPSRFQYHLNLARLHWRRGSPFFNLSTAIVYAGDAISDVYGTPRERMRQIPEHLHAIESGLLRLSTSTAVSKSWMSSSRNLSRLSARSSNSSGVNTAELRVSLLNVYRQIIELIPRVAYFGLDLKTRLIELAESEHLGAAAALHALILGEPEEAVELLEGARAVFWSQALHLRSSLGILPPDVSAKLTELFRDLEKGSHIPRARGNQIPSIPAWRDQDLVERRRKSLEAEKLIHNLRQTPGFERFLLVQPYSVLAKAAAKGPVIVLVAHTDVCEAIVITSAAGAIQHIPLPDCNLGDLRELGMRVKDSNLRSSTQTQDGSDEPGRPAKVFKPGQSKSKLDTYNSHSRVCQSNGEEILAELWHRIVKPIMGLLGLRVSVLNIRIWRLPKSLTSRIIEGQGSQTRPSALVCDGSFCLLATSRGRKLL